MDLIAGQRHARVPSVPAVHGAGATAPPALGERVISDERLIGTTAHHPPEHPARDL
jgi:hypothetical protein